MPPLGPAFASTIDAWLCFCAAGVPAYWAPDVVRRKVATLAAKRDLELLVHGDDHVMSSFGRAVGWRKGGV